MVHNSPYAQAVVINSGVANACTGEEGYGYCMDMAETVGNEMKLPKDAVLVASTGVIGRQLPMDIIKEGIKENYLRDLSLMKKQQHLRQKR